MNIQDGIKQQIKDDIDLVRKGESLMTKVVVSDDNQRDMLLLGFTRNVISHFLSINFLIEKKLYNSAFALVRVFFENVIKLKYMYYIMDDTKIATVYTANSWDKHFPSIGEMARAIDEEFEVEFYTAIKQKAYNIMNDYTHTGPNQIARNFSESDVTVEANFSDELILETLKSNNTLLHTTTITFLEGIGFKNGFISKNEMDEYVRVLL